VIEDAVLRYLGVSPSNAAAAEPWSGERLLTLAAGTARADLEASHPHLWLLRPLSVGERAAASFTTVAVLPRSASAPPGIASACALLYADPRSLAVHPVLKVQGIAWSDRLLIGRAGNNDIVIRDDGISKLHAWLALQPDGVRVFDARSSNGTWVDGVRVGEDGAPARSGSILRLGRLWAILVASGPLWDELAGLRRR
jgi:hypothetical protein